MQLRLQRNVCHIYCRYKKDRTCCQRIPDVKGLGLEDLNTRSGLP